MTAWYAAQRARLENEAMVYQGERGRILTNVRLATVEPQGISGSNTVCVLIEPVERPRAWNRGVIRTRARVEAGGKAEKGIMAGFDSDGLTDHSHERRITHGKVNTQIDRSAKADGRNQVTEAKKVGLGLDGKRVSAGCDCAIVVHTEH